MLTKIINWLKEKLDFSYCHKEQMGCTCHHRTYKDGSRECD